MSQKVKFTIWYGLAASLALHSALAGPFAAYNLISRDDRPPILVVELQGAVADSQATQKVLQQTKGDEKQELTDQAKPTKTPAPETPPPPDKQPAEVAENGQQSPTPPAQATPSPESQTSPQPSKPQVEGGANNVKGVEEQQAAQMIKQDDEADRLAEYIKLLTKRVEAHLIYPDEGRQAGLQGTATVSFTILGSGRIRPETLKVIESSGQPKLDASALNTVRASVPFDPPPKEMTVAIGVAFGRKR